MKIGIDYWQTDSYNKTMIDAIKEFANTYWDKPRRARKPDKDGVFMIIGGVNKYQCQFVDNIPPVWRIERISTRTD